MFRKFRLHAVLIVACAIIIVFPMLREKPAPEKAEVATRVANDFFALIDVDRFEASWDSGSSLLQQKTSRKDWVKNLTTIRKQFGPLIDRAQAKSRYTTSAKDSPDGEYIILDYASQFKNHPDAKESIIVTFEKDNVWRVAGYHLQ
ncbi:MAG: hypothetical protein C0618_02135 [Desulfuromonas sp.]|nr:MAG: hypothetical protein C0618_02135 [Desulfuromonas sp.]